MKTSWRLFILLEVLLCGTTGTGAQLNKNLTETELQLRKEVKPYLDSLTVEEPKVTDKDISMFRLEAIFPPESFTRFGTNEGEFTAFIPDNPRLKGLVTDPLPLLGGARISLIYSFVDDNKQNVSIAGKYCFESVREKDSAEGDRVRQSLYLTVLNDLRFSSIKVGMLDVVMLPPENGDKPINNLPSVGYRSMSFSRTEGDQYMLSYLLRSSEGVYSSILRSEGSDRTLPEYTGGSAAQFWFIRQNMQYPEKAVEEQVSGTVLVSCTVEPDGSVTNPHVFLGSEPLLNDEAIRLVALTSGKWIPATRNGENIADEKVVPVTFDLNHADVKVVSEAKKARKKLPLKTYLLLGTLAILAILYLRYKFFKKDRKFHREPRPHVSVSNDKIVIVAGLDQEQMELMIREFTEIFNVRYYYAIIRMHAMSPQVFALTFPFDIKWEYLMELINHLTFFYADEPKAQMRAWLTLPEECGQAVGEHAMMFVKEDDEEYDFIRLTTRYNHGFKYDFETEKIIETETSEDYVNSPFTYSEIMQTDFVEIY